MKIFSTDYLEAMSEDVDGNDWSWRPVSGYKMITGTRGRPTKTIVFGREGPRHVPHQTDQDVPSENSDMIVV